MAVSSTKACMQHPDVSLFLWMAGGPSPTRWVLALAVAAANAGPWLCAAVMAWAAWRRPRERGYLLALLAMAGLTTLVTHAIADRIGLPRPFVLGLSPAHIAHGASAALPSTHAAVMGLVTLGFLLRPSLRRWAALLGLVTLATGWGRVYVGVHFPSDIAAGFMLAAVMLGVFAGLQWLVWRRRLPAFAGIQSRGPARRTTTP